MSNAEINTIREYLKQHGFSNVALIDDLVDHLATEIELIQADNGADFEEAFTSAKEKLLPEIPHELEIDLKLLTTQKHNIMIKKIAFIGGYLSAICLTVSILFAILSFQNNYQVSIRREVIKSQYLSSNIKEEATPETISDIYNTYHNETSLLKLQSLNQLGISQTLMVVSILILSTTYLPYQFYARYQRSELELLAS